MKPQFPNTRRISMLMVSLCAFELIMSASMTAQAEPAVGVTPTVIGRATYGAFDLQSDLGFAAQAKSPLDIVVRTMTTHQEARRGGIRIRARSSSQSLKAK